MALAKSFPSLHPKASTFTHNDGRTVNLLHTDGTIPIAYQGTTYNIPVMIWLLEPYPRSPPAVFLSPTRDMVVKPSHPHVDCSSSILVPYLRSWVYPSSNLVDLVRSLSHIFSLDPPLYTHQNAYNNPTNPNPNLSPSSSLSPSPSPSSSSLLSRIYSSLLPYGERFPLSSQVVAIRPIEDQLRSTATMQPARSSIWCTGIWAKRKGLSLEEGQEREKRDWEESWRRWRGRDWIEGEEERESLSFSMISRTKGSEREEQRDEEGQRGFCTQAFGGEMRRGKRRRR